MLGELVAHRADVDKGINIAIQNDDACRDITGRDFCRTVSWTGAVFATKSSMNMILWECQEKRKTSEALNEVGEDGRVENRLPLLLHSEQSDEFDILYKIK